MTEPFTFDLKKLSERARKDNILARIGDLFLEDFGLIPCVGVEIEFYLPNDDLSGAPFVIKQEKGKFQYEIDLPPLQDLDLCAEEIEAAKASLKKWNSGVDFRSKPFSDDYGSAMHFHINLLTKGGENYFDDNVVLELAARSLCHYMLTSFVIFAPKEEDYMRFDHKFMAPNYVSFGGNNRSVAVRIPSLVPKRLEHRICAPTADSYLAIFVILKSIYLGLKDPQHIDTYDKIYGNAFDAQYDLTPFPKDLKEALEMFDEHLTGIKD